MDANNPTPQQAKDILAQLGENDDHHLEEPAPVGSISPRELLAACLLWGIFGPLMIVSHNTTWLLVLFAIAAVGFVIYAIIHSMRADTRPNSRTPLGQDPPLARGTGRALAGTMLNYFIVTFGGQALRDFLPTHLLIPGACAAGVLLVAITYFSLAPTLKTTTRR